MALDRKKTLDSAEQLLKQGKVQEALESLEQVADGAPTDLLSLNRVGDMLARAGRIEEATGYYARIADQFTQQGFYPKAVAIHKKILRLNPEHPATLRRLGELYVKQRHPGGLFE